MSARRAPTRGYDALPEWQRQVRYELFERRLVWKTEKTSLELDWDQLAGWFEGENAFDLAQGHQQIVLPKRGFEHDAEIDAVRELLATRARFGDPPKGVTLFRRPRAFIVVLWLLLVGMFVIIFQLVQR